MDTLGRHILVELYDMPAEILDDVHRVEKGMIAAAEQAGATIIHSTFHHFSPIGVSGVVVIQESHLAIHTWPEMGYAAVDIFTCGTEVNPWLAYDYLKERFEAKHGSSMELLRGHRELLHRQQKEQSRSGEQLRKEAISHSWFTSRDDYLALSLRYEGDRLFFQQSPFQKVEVYHTLAYGKMLALDGRIVSTERDEYIYHEMITHVAMQTVQSPNEVLVIGGGDGGIVRELLCYEQLSKIIVVELDPIIPKAANILHEQHEQWFAHPKVQLLLEDGKAYLQQAKQETFDVIVVDFVPDTLTEETSMFQNCKDLLQSNGVLIVQSEAPRFTPERFVDIHQQLRSVFGANQVYPYLTYIPTYPTGTWSFAYCSKGASHPQNLPSSDHLQQFVETQQLQYYNEAIHRAAFALPNDLAKLWAQSKPEAP